MRIAIVPNVTPSHPLLARFSDRPCMGFELPNGIPATAYLSTLQDGLLYCGMGVHIVYRASVVRLQHL